MSAFTAAITLLGIGCMFYSMNMDIWRTSRRGVEGLFERLIEIHDKHGMPRHVAEEWIKWAKRTGHALHEWESSSVLWRTMIPPPSVDWNGAIELTRFSEEQTCNVEHLAQERCKVEQQ